MYSDDIAAQTKHQMAKSETSPEEDPFYQEALKTGIDSNISSIRNYFASKTPPKPFSNYDAPTIPEHPFTDRKEDPNMNTGPSGMRLPVNNNTVPNDQTIDELSNNIVNMLSKAIEKATPKVQYVERPNTAAGYIQPPAEYHLQPTP
jgi:hypothetical protein